MKSRLVLPVVLLAAVPILADDAQNERKKFQGLWQVISIEENKEVIPDVIAKSIQLLINGDRVTLKGTENLGITFDRITFRLDPCTNPPAIDFVIDGAENGTHKAIYEVNGDDLRLCVSTLDGNRPDAFETAGGSNRALLLLTRAQKQP
jgi:uncharacterized protein (TIGR03067 family)